MFPGLRNPRPVGLALQGGGAHGAFTWGVLDALLEDGRVDFEAVSGTSAGAMNAVVLAHGLLAGGREGAREALARFWHAVAAATPFGMSSAPNGVENGGLAPALKMMLQWAQHFSPYELNPFDINPLRDIVGSQIDFERLRAASPLRLFIATTHANTGKLRVFHTHELTADALLASACLPNLHHTVEIDGEPYWDGGYSANPAVFPLFYECRTRDILLVLLSPLLRDRTPRTATEIRGRALDLAFTATFLREMRMYAHARAFARQDWLPLGRLERRLRSVRFHLIEAEELMSQLAGESRLTTSLPFLEMLRDRGRQRAAAWLAACHHNLGRRSSVDIDALFY
ncbi:patatin-like phospholipase family protein [Pseudothauera rhizosphaerae]|uniref:Patatin-like phospholipase family protein n=1 Tax=Pseudothauera rhizosphaerae TaxID=2565932 RepID=A0A4S4AS42_9RHOO|nr:patatin-like phospholipase family protein [Pseudothauera rhizosphaerae]THF62630.1 patatin-like phospholipase family protein [Pseudothauera rhizosphaerae]